MANAFRPEHRKALELLLGARIEAFVFAFGGTPGSQFFVCTERGSIEVFATRELGLAKNVRPFGPDELALACEASGATVSVVRAPEPDSEGENDP